MTRPNYELLGRQWPYRLTLEELTQARKQNSRLDASPSFATRSSQIRDKLMLPVLQHLGFGPVEGVRREVNYGIDLAVDYFCGTWWKLGEFPMDENALRSADRDRPWFDVFTTAMFLCGLAARWDHLEKICSWFDATVQPEFRAGQIEDEYMELFICIAGKLSPTQVEGMEEVLGKVKKCRTKRARLLCAAWEAADAADQTTFDKAFKETIAHFLTKPGGAQVYDWVAIHQSAVWFVAERRGLRFPALPAKFKAAIVTRESTGIAD